MALIIVLPSSSDSRKPRAAPALTDRAPGGRQPWVWRERPLGGFPLPAGLRPLHPWGSPGCPQVTLPRATLNKGRKSVKLPGVAPSWPHTLEAACSALLPQSLSTSRPSCHWRAEDASSCYSASSSLPLCSPVWPQGNKTDLELHLELPSILQLPTVCSRDSQSVVPGNLSEFANSQPPPQNN